ncbi:MAG: serine/threonine protein kinase [Acidobacteria bacterium]|nr:serine/threonine protein kinase [Acidobacteriota bacterium]
MDPGKLGRYVIEGVLGKGAMGVVYLAVDPVIGRRVALKTLAVPADSEEAQEFAQRFLREAQAAGILNHPVIVTVHDAGVDDDTGLSFIAMEYIEGRSLKEMLQAGHAFSAIDVAMIGAAVADALDYAHAQGVVHRDVKPANILITSRGQAKITDFGVARLESSNLTAAGQFIGTPNYMAPEQITGSAVDGRSDLFSLGVVLFELLTGARPFGGSSMTEVTYKIVHEPPPIPSRARPGLPSAFNPIVLKLLEKDPARRYQRGADLARVLESLGQVLAEAAGAPVPRSASGTTGKIPTAAIEAARAAEPPAAAAAAPATAKPSLWRLPIQPRWVGVLLAAAVVPVAAVIVALALAIDRGPWPTPADGEPARRHRVGVALREAERALQASRPDEVERLLAEVFDQAPFSRRARELRLEARASSAATTDLRQRRERAAQLQAQGKELVREGRWREAEAAFSESLALVPDDQLSRDYLDYVRERASSPRATPPPRLASAARTAATPARPTGPAAGPARVDLYFNSPLTLGEVELLLDGQPLARRPFDHSERGFLGVKRKGTGIVTDRFSVPGGRHDLAVRLRGEEGRLLGEQVFRGTFAAEQRLSLRIEMDGEQGTPRFTLTERPR